MTQEQIADRIAVYIKRKVTATKSATELKADIIEIMNDSQSSVHGLITACEQVVAICEDGDTGAAFERVASAMESCAKALEAYRTAAYPQAPAPPAQGIALCKFICADGSVCGKAEDAHKSELHMHKFVKQSPFIPAPSASPGLERIAQEIAEKIVADYEL